MGKKKKEKVMFYTGSGTILLKNVIKRGMDTSKFINMVVCYPDPDHYKMENAPVPPNMFFIHDITFSEALGVIIHKFGMSKQDTKKRIKRWIDNYNIQRIREENMSEEYYKIVKEANKKVVQRFGEDYNIGDNDCKILAGFLKEGINIVHVKDKGFEETCKELNINVILTPKRDLEKEKLLRAKLGK